MFWTNEISEFFKTIITKLGLDQGSSHYNPSNMPLYVVYAYGDEHEI